MDGEGYHDTATPSSDILVIHLNEPLMVSSHLVSRVHIPYLLHSESGRWRYFRDSPATVIGIQMSCFHEERRVSLLTSDRNQASAVCKPR